MASPGSILLDDLQALVRASPLPPKTSSFQSWSIGLEQYVRSGRLQPELDAWLALARAQSARLPLDFPAPPDANPESAARSVSLALGVEETSALLHELPAAYHVQINDVMLTAPALAFAGWTGAGALLVDLEGHGREDLWDGLDPRALSAGSRRSSRCCWSSSPAHLRPRRSARSRSS